MSRFDSDLQIRHLLLLAVFCFVRLISPAQCQAEEAIPAKPNIIFILSDDQRFDTLGAVGNKDIQTPNLDAFAANGIVFTHASVCVPICAPSRASLLTGVTPHQHRYYSNKTWSKDVDHHFTTVTALERLVQAGYQTCLIGKWHVNPEPWKCGITEARIWMPAGAGPYVDAELAHGMNSKTNVVKGHVTEIFSRDAIEFLQRQGADSRRDSTQVQRPFFLWLAYTAPHTPQKPVPARSMEPYLAMPAENRPPGFPPGEKVTGPWAQYYSAITHMDEQIGLVLKAIDENGFRDNTVVIFMSDNGWMMGSHERHGKIVPEDESIRVPLVVRAPAGIQGWIGRTDALVSSLDLPPTWLALAGVKPPDEWPGSSLAPLLRDAAPKLPFRDDVISEFEDEKAWPGFAFRLVRSHDWKYVLRPIRTEKDLHSLDKRFTKEQEDHESRKAPDLEHEQLFDLKTDPYELHNIAQSPESQAALKEMRGRMETWMEKTQDPARKWLH